MLKIKDVQHRSQINYKDKNGNPKVLHKATVTVYGEIAFQHEFVSSDREIQVGDEVSFQSWSLVDNFSVKDGHKRVSITCDPAGIVKNAMAK